MAGQFVSKKNFMTYCLADRTGLEPATSAVTGRHSNQLNYRSSLVAVFLRITNRLLIRTGFLGTAKIALLHFVAKCFSRTIFKIHSNVLTSISNKYLFFNP